MAQHYYTHNTLNIAMSRDPETGEIGGVMGTLPNEIIESEWTDHGIKSYAQAQNDIRQQVPDTRSDQEKQLLYTAFINAGHSEQQARQISGYTGE